MAAGRERDLHSERTARRRRHTAAIYRRRRLTALAALAGIVFLGILLVGALTGDADSLSPDEERRAAWAEDPIELTVSVSGDLLIHSPIWAVASALGGGPYDFAPMLAKLRPYVETADLALCHVETPISPEPPATFPLFSAPEELATAIAATGFDGCDTASNHSLDQHVDGIADTESALDAAEVRHTGSASSAQGDDRSLVFDVEGIRVGVVAYTDATNGIPPPAPWTVNTAEDPEEAAALILRDARAARKEGADAVIVNMHWGDENSTEPNDSQLELADLLTESPLIEAVVGQGPHVVQPIQRINGKPVVFSEGNLLSNQSAVAGLPAETQYGLIALLHFTADGKGVHATQVEYVPTTVRLSDYTVLPVGDALRSGEASKEELRTAYESVVGLAGQGNGINPLPREFPGT